MQFHQTCVSWTHLTHKLSELCKIQSLTELHNCVEERGFVVVFQIRILLTRGAIHRQSGQYVRAVDELLTAVDKCKGEERERGSTYSAACRQLVLTYNDFAIQCFK